MVVMYSVIVDHVAGPSVCEVASVGRLARVQCSSGAEVTHLLL